MKQIFLLLMLMSTQFVLAQTKISGSVLFKNKGVQHASVSLVHSYDGATTDANGWFTFETEEKGIQVILVQHPDYSDQYDTITISHQSIELTISLKENFKAIDAVVISAGKMEASNKKRATVLLSALDMYTTAGADGQASQALTTLPGIQSVGNASGLFVRGGTGNETQFYIDGNLINHYFSNTVPGFSGRDRMNPSLFKGNVFSTGGYSAQYGQALSSVLALESVDFPSQSSVDLGITPFFINGGFQQVNEPKTKSYGLMTTYTDFGLMKKLMSQTIEFKEVPKSWASNFNFRLKTKNGIVKYYGSYDQNIMSITQPSVEQETLKNETALKSNNTFHSLFWKEQWGRYTLNMGSSFTYNSTCLNFKTLENGQELFNHALETNDYYLNTKTTLERKIGHISAIRAGMEWNFADERTQLPQLNLQYPSVQYRLATFVDSDWGISKTLALNLGLRSEYTSLTASWTYAPRAAVGYRIAKGFTSSLAYGIYYQNPETKYLIPEINLKPQKATHWVFQLQKQMSDRTLRLELFSKTYQQLMTTKFKDFRPIAMDNSGYGYAKGIELFWRDKKTIRNVDYWISYSYLDTKRQFMNYPQSLMPDFVYPHTLSLVAKKFIPEWKTGFNASFRWASGRPYYDINETTNATIIRQQGILKDNVSLDMSVNYVPSLGKKNAKVNTVWVLSMNNILGRNNVYGYQFSSDGQRQIEQRPAFKQFFMIGVFLNFGVDKTQEIIDRNL